MVKKCVLALSGGLDSSVLLHKACEEFDKVHCIFFDYDQRHRRELDSACDQISDANLRSFKADLITCKLPLRTICPVSSLTIDSIDTPDVRTMLGEAQPLSYVPFRNMLFLSILLSYAESRGADTVWYGAAGVDTVAGYWDADKTFVKRMNEVAELNREHQIRIEAPLIELSKKQIIELGVSLKVDFKKTWTCYSGNEKADPYTPSSSSRLKGFVEAGYIDPIEYDKDLTQLWEKNNCKPITF
jgi:7-cyano-7-deazaguanine synthase